MSSSHLSFSLLLLAAPFAYCQSPRGDGYGGFYGGMGGYGYPGADSGAVSGWGSSGELGRSTSFLADLLSTLRSRGEPAIIFYPVPFLYPQDAPTSSTPAPTEPPSTWPPVQYCTAWTSPSISNIVPASCTEFYVAFVYNTCPNYQVAYDFGDLDCLSIKTDPIGGGNILYYNWVPGCPLGTTQSGSIASRNSFTGSIDSRTYVTIDTTNLQCEETTESASETDGIGIR